ncbi:uncharacterized protein F5891DRAFT_1185727 [Suillus fuscotomentosus]|uniref:Uncharacterized protein n=1 Tax=Suillus fuscotomentosus TaxID=1912939 RepID=A0AAD4EB82_9AGAM|nr:uncharacterized protein F5891DRAFT_1278022 [Suillus fuscotomentosus]XP_041228660.1 uncharacterized protein F5891DRAFT_1185727 [Suillus fuscotomentosus]KAG1900765.1 hypothetical protein F5891DRAFT_1278022 [Suillus fuscotomentosus]KAG1903085.1 hypothetical protein F5891DRAFT_1185727 [Suillus fuscotomentosus]
MAPHLHTSSASKSTTTGGQTGSGRTTRSEITNTEKTVNSPFAGSSSEAEAVRITNLDPQIHTADIAPFAKFALEEKVRELANRSGFQPDVIRVVYKHSRTFKQAENITESMRAAAVKCAVAKIKRVMLYGTEDGGEDEGIDEDKE